MTAGAQLLCWGRYLGPSAALSIPALGGEDVLATQCGAVPGLRRGTCGRRDASRRYWEERTPFRSHVWRALRLAFSGVDILFPYNG